MQIRFKEVTQDFHSNLKITLEFVPQCRRRPLNSDQAHLLLSQAKRFFITPFRGLNMKKTNHINKETNRNTHLDWAN